MVPTLPPLPDGYVYLGCFPDGMLRLLDGAVQKLPTMTLDACVSYCNSVSLSRFYPLLGVEHSNSCYCGSGFARDAGVRNELGCDNSCAGDNGTVCGGQGYINVYNATKVPATLTPATTTMPGIQAFTVVATVTETETVSVGGSTSSSGSTPISGSVGMGKEGPNATITGLSITAGVLGACLLVVSALLFLSVRRKLVKKWNNGTDKSVLSSTLVGTENNKVRGPSYESHEMGAYARPLDPGEGYFEVPHIAPR